MWYSGVCFGLRVLGYKKLQKKIAKYLERIKKRFYFALAFENYGSGSALKRVLRNIFRKKTWQKFGG